MALGASRPVIGLLAVLQLAVAGAVIGITGVHMANVDIFKPQTLLNQKTCLLSAEGNTSICLYAYALGAVSIVLTFSIGLLQICTCNMCGCGALMDSVFAVMAAGWWVVGGFIISTNATRANSQGLQAREWRDAVAWLTWICAILFGALFMVHMMRVISKHCSCFRRRRGPENDSEKAAPQGQRPRSAALELGNEVRGRSYMTANRPGQASLQQQFNDNRNI